MPKVLAMPALSALFAADAGARERQGSVTGPRGRSVTRKGSISR